MNWKGDKASKSAIHKWMNSHYGKPLFCEACGKEDNNVYDWANISGEYHRTREDFLRLCRTCHRRFDLTPEKREKAIKNLWWVRGIPYPGKPNIQNLWYGKDKEKTKAFLLSKEINE